MNIDLLITQRGEAGLLCSENLVKKALGALFDPENGMLSLEFTDMDHMELNIPVEGDYHGLLDASPMLHIGSAKEGKIAQAYQIPLMFLNDPYRAQALDNLDPPKRPLEAFYYFVKNCILGQPVHRADAGNEDSIGCILGDVSPSSLEFAAHLARRHGIELGNVKAAELNVPGMGLGGSTSSRSSGGTYYKGSSSDSSGKNTDKDKE